MRNCKAQTTVRLSWLCFSLSVVLGGSGLYFITGRAPKDCLFPVSTKHKNSSMKRVVGSETLGDKEMGIFVCLGYEASSKMETFVF